jgi:hypothetical protein
MGNATDFTPLPMSGLPLGTIGPAEEGKSRVVDTYIHMLDEARVRHRKLRRYARFVLGFTFENLILLTLYSEL